MKKTFNHNWERAVAQKACQSIAEKILEMDVSDVEISQDLSERVAKLIAEESAHLNARKRFLRKRIAIAVIAAVVAALTACMSIPTIREKLYEIVITYHDKYFTYKSEPIDTGETEADTFTTSDNGDTEPLSTESTPSTESPSAEFVTKRPTYIPEGYELYMDLSTDLTTHIIFFNTHDGSMVSYEQYFVGKGIYDFDYDEVDLNEISIGKYKGFVTIKLTESVEEVSLLWNDGVYDYFVNAALSLEETLKIAESIE